MKISKKKRDELYHKLAPSELACRMLNAIGWDGNNFRLRDPVSLAIAPEVERINKNARSIK